MYEMEEKTMKKKLVLGMVCFMVTLGVIGCSDDSSNSQSTATSEVVTQQEGEEKAEADTEIPEADVIAEDVPTDPYADYRLINIVEIGNEHFANQLRTENKYIGMKVYFIGKLERINTSDDVIYINDINDENYVLGAQYSEEDKKLCNEIEELNSEELVSAYGIISYVYGDYVQIKLEHIKAYKEEQNLGRANTANIPSKTVGDIEIPAGADIYNTPIDISDLTGEYVPMEGIFCLYVTKPDSSDSKVFGNMIVEVPGVEVMYDAELLPLTGNVYQLSYVDMDSADPVIVTFYPDDESPYGYGAMIFRAGEYLDSYVLSSK